MNTPDLCAALRAVVRWSVDAAKEHVDLARFSGETPDPAASLGLWESFREAFPKADFPDVYDVLINVHLATYSETVGALAVDAALRA